MLEIWGESLLEKIEFCCFRIAALGEQCPLLKKTFPPLLSKSLPFSKAGPTNEGSKHDSRPTWTECGPLGYRRGYTSHLYRSCAASGTSAIRTNIFNSHVHRITAIFFLPLNIFKQRENKQPQAPLTDPLHLHCESHCHEVLCWKNPPP